MYKEEDEEEEEDEDEDEEEEEEEEEEEVQEGCMKADFWRHPRYECGRGSRLEAVI